MVRLDSCTLQLPLTGNKSVSQLESKCAPPITSFQVQAIKFRPNWRSNRATSGWCLLVCHVGDICRNELTLSQQSLHFCLPSWVNITSLAYLHIYSCMMHFQENFIVFLMLRVTNSSFHLNLFEGLRITVFSDKIMTHSLNSLPRFSRIK